MIAWKEAIESSVKLMEMSTVESVLVPNSDAESPFEVNI